MKNEFEMTFYKMYDKHIFTNLTERNQPKTLPQNYSNEYEVFEDRLMQTILSQSKSGDIESIRISGRGISRLGYPKSLTN